MDFEHQPLSCNSTSFRILSLMPGTLADDISCSLFESKFGSQGITHRYEALSYTWGIQARTSPITINGKRFFVTSSLIVALRSLRDLSVPHNLWIDAICIDQSDKVEKSAQVAIMRQIYTGAQSVVIWLGPEADGSTMVMKYLHNLWLLEGRPSPLIFSGDGDLNEWYKNRISRGWESGNLDANSIQAQVRHGALADPILSRAVQAFFSRSWWKRTWVVQEVSHAKKATIICGSEKLSWTCLESYFVKFHGNTFIFVKHPELNDPGILTINRASQLVITRITNLCEEIGFKMTLLSNLSYLSHTEASDPRDKVYGLIGLRNNMDHGLIPDYEKPPCQVYIDATKAILEHDSYSQIDAILGTQQMERVPQFTLNVISKTVRIGLSSTVGLPSWVPDWNCPEQPWDLVKSYDKIQAFSAAGRFCTLKKAPIIENSSILLANGYLWDLVDKVSNQLDSSNLDTGDWEDIIRSWTPKNIHSHIYPNGGNAEDAFWRSLLQDRSTEKSRRLNRFETFTYKQEYLSWAKKSTVNEHSSNSSNIQTQNPRHSSSLAPFENHMSELTFGDLLPRLVGWKFCVSRKGYYGSVPAAVEVGDLICVLYGCCVPLILRRIPFSLPDHFILIGSAYVDGIMDGEVIQSCETEHETVFKIV